MLTVDAGLSFEMACRPYADVDTLPGPCGRTVAILSKSSLFCMLQYTKHTDDHVAAHPPTPHTFVRCCRRCNSRRKARSDT